MLHSSTSFSAVDIRSTKFSWWWHYYLWLHYQEIDWWYCYFTVYVIDTFNNKRSWIPNCLDFCIRRPNYSQTCSNDHLYKLTTHLRQPTLSPPKQIPIQSLLYKTTTCLTWPATTFFVSQVKINLSEITTTKFYPAKKWETSIKQQYIKIKRLSLYLLYCYFIMQNLCNAYKNWTIYKIK